MLGLYIHIPFCSKKCYYCDFTSYINHDNKIDSYIKSVLFELAKYRDKKFTTIFIGGGTPSYLNEKQLSHLLDGISRVININDILEFTIECNPGTLNYEKVYIMKSYGVNRLSIGVQSANEDTLKFIGRVHTFNDFDKSINFAYRGGIKNINADLIFGIPNESFDDYKNTLELISKYDLKHISCYNLILEENTKFYDMYIKGKLNEIEEDTQVLMYNYTKRYLESLGFIQYEVSNYAKPGNECIHNLIYWNFDEYLGVGVSAHSYYDNKRFYNTKSIDDYIMMCSKNEHNYESINENSVSDNIEEYIMVGLRKIKGISLNDFQNRFKLDINDIFKNVIEKHKRNDLLKINNENLVLTHTGFLLMNIILRDFINEL